MAEIIALAASFLLVVLAGAPVIRWLQRAGCRQHIREDGPARHLPKAGTPTMGGLLILGALMLISLLAGAMGGLLSWELLLLLALTLAFAGLGLADDWRMIRRGRSLGLRARYKLLLQFALAALFLWAAAQLANRGPLLTLPFASGSLWLGWSYWPLAAIFIVWTSNSVNLTDGLDGLAAGLCAIAAATFALLAFWAFAGAVSLFCASLTGACLGFICFNAYPARVFMGDTGSLALGAALAGAAVLLRAELLLFVFGLLFFVESISVIIQVISFQLTGRRVFRMSPVHHHFELAGWKEPHIVFAFLVTAGLLSSAVIWWALKPGSLVILWALGLRPG